MSKKKNQAPALDTSWFSVRRRQDKVVATLRDIKQLEKNRTERMKIIIWLPNERLGDTRVLKLRLHRRLRVPVVQAEARLSGL